MELYLIEYNGKVIGAYDNHDLAKQFIDSCTQLKFMIGTSKILRYARNSCLLLNDDNIVQQPIQVPTFELPRPKIINNIDENVKPIDLENNEDYKKISKEKAELLKNLNELKLKKEKLEEFKRIFENDIKLYNMFNENRNKDPNFVIPELFLQKFYIIKELQTENNLNWESYNQQYNMIKNSNNYTDYFASNSYEDKFIKQNMANINEEIEIETDSETESESDN